MRRPGSAVEAGTQGPVRPGVPVRMRVRSGPVTPLRGSVRALRIGTLGGASLLLAAGAHLAGGGRLPGAGVLVVIAVVLGLLASVITARRCRLPLLSGVLGGEQVVLHHLLAAAASPGGLGCVPAGHQHLAVTGCLPSGSAATAAGHAAMAAGSGWPPAMLIGHVVAVIATAWILARGEAWIWGLAEQLVRSAVVASGSVPVAVRRVALLGDLAALVTVPMTAGSPRGPPTRMH